MKQKSRTIADKIVCQLEYISQYKNLKIIKNDIIPSDSEYILIKDVPEKINDMKEKKIARKSESENVSEKFNGAKSLSELEKIINKCDKCPLCETRKKFVFGTGNSKSKIVIIGEAPGADEDEQGKPFVGRAGKLLTDILKAIELKREDIFITNILKCRPPGNRNPLSEEIEHCLPYLIKQMNLINPDYILALGTFAGQTILKSKESLGKMRAKIHIANFFGKDVKVVVTYHPAALLRNPNWKRPTWEDVKMFKNEFEKTLKS